MRSQHHGWGIQYWSSLCIIQFTWFTCIIVMGGISRKKNSSDSPASAASALAVFFFFTAWRSEGRAANKKITANDATKNSPFCVVFFWGWNRCWCFLLSLNKKMGTESTHFFILLARNKGVVRFYLLKFIMSWDVSSQQQPPVSHLVTTRHLLQPS